MNYVAKLIYGCVLILGLSALNGCFDNDRDKQSFDEGPGPLDVEVNIDQDNGNIPVGLELRAAPQSSSVSLDWDAVSTAVDYRVSRQIEGKAKVVETTGGATTYSFSAQEATTYMISVKAIDDSGQVISKSKVIEVNTPMADALKLSDEGL